MITLVVITIIILVIYLLTRIPLIYLIAMWLFNVKEDAPKPELYRRITIGLITIGLVAYAIKHF